MFCLLLVVRCSLIGVHCSLGVVCCVLCDVCCIGRSLLFVVFSSLRADC